MSSFSKGRVKDLTLSLNFDYKCEDGDAGIRQTGRDGLCPKEVLGSCKLQNVLVQCNGQNGDAGICQGGRDGLCPYDTLEPKLENPEPNNMTLATLDTDGCGPSEYFLIAGSYKEQHRLAMIKWSEEIRNADYTYFCKAAIEKYKTNLSFR